MVLQLRLPTLVLALFLWLSRALCAQTLDPTFHIPEIYGEARIADAAQMPNGQYVVGGDFTRANGQNSKGLARFDAVGVEDQTFRQNLSAATIAVTKLLPMLNGQLLVQGSYQAGAVQRNHLFRLNADGTLDPTLSITLLGTFPGRILETLLQADGRIVIRGDFTTNVHAEIMRLQSDGTPDPSFSFSMPYGSQVNQMLLQPDGKIIISGPFGWLNGNRAFFLARLNGDGSTNTGFQSAAYTNAALYINSIALDANNSLLVGGLGINVVNGQATPLFRLLSTGAIDPSFTCPASLINRDCERISVHPNGQISVLASTFSSVTQSYYPFSSQLYRLQANGAFDTTFQPGVGPDNVLEGIRVLNNGNMLTWGEPIWGGISNFAGQRRTVALVQSTGALDASFAPLLQNAGSIQKIVRQANGALMITGRFNTIDGHLTDRIARLLPSGQPDVSFSWRQPASATWTTNALVVQTDGRILVAGSTTAPVFTRLMPSGATDAGFVPALPLNLPSDTTYIAILAEQANGQILVGGRFVDNAGRVNLTRLTASGAIEPTFTPRTNQPRILKGIVQANGALTTMSWEYSIERLLANGQLDPSFTFTLPVLTPVPGFPSAWVDNIFSLPYSGNYAVSGILSSTEVLARLAPNGTITTGFASPLRPGSSNTYVHVVAEQSDGNLLVGGYLRQSSQYNAPLAVLARLNANGQLDPSFDLNFISPATSSSYTPYPFFPVSDVLVQPDGALVIGGYFLQAGGQPATGLVRLRPVGVLSVRSGISTQTEVWPVPAHEVLQLKLDASARPQRVMLLDVLGKVVLTQLVTQSELTLNTAALARGLYVLRVDYASGPATQRVVLE